MQGHRRPCKRSHASKCRKLRTLSEHFDILDLARNTVSLSLNACRCITRPTRTYPNLSVHVCQCWMIFFVHHASQRVSSCRCLFFSPPAHTCPSPLSTTATRPKLSTVRLLISLSNPCCQPGHLWKTEVPENSPQLERGMYNAEGLRGTKSDLPAGMPTSNASVYNQSVVFSCIASDSDSRLTGRQIEATQWRTTLCQLGEGGNNLSAWSAGLVSEFRPLAPVNFSLPGARDEQSCLWGVKYLVLNITKRDFGLGGLVLWKLLKLRKHVKSGDRGLILLSQMEILYSARHFATRLL